MKEVRGEYGEIEKKFYEKVLERQKVVTEERYGVLRNMLEVDFSGDWLKEILKKLNILFDYCKEEGKNEEAGRIMSEDYDYFETILDIIKGNAEIDVFLNVEKEEIMEIIEKRRVEFIKKVEGQRKVIIDLLGEKIKYKARMEKYVNLINEIIFRKKHNIMNEFAIKDLNWEFEAGQGLVDMIMSKRLKMTVDCGNLAGNLEKEAKKRVKKVVKNGKKG